MTGDLDRDLVDLGAGELPAPDLSRLLERELAYLVPVTPRRPHRQLGLVATTATIVVALLLLGVGIRADLGELPAVSVLAVALGWMAGGVGAAWFALVPRRGAVMPSATRGAWLALGISCAFVGLGLIAHPAGPSSLDYGWTRLPAGLGCLELGLATACPPLLVGAWFARGTAPIGSASVAAALGAAAGCAGGFLLHFSCRIADGPHVGLVHGGVVGCTAMLAALVLPRAVTPRT